MRYLIPLRQGRGVPSLVAVVLAVLLILFVAPLLSWQGEPFLASLMLRIVLALAVVLGWLVYYLVRYGSQALQGDVEVELMEQARQQRQQRRLARRELDRWLRRLPGRGGWRRSQFRPWWLVLTSEQEQAATAITQLWPVQAGSQAHQGQLRDYSAAETTVLAVDFTNTPGPWHQLGMQPAENYWRLLTRRIRKWRHGVPLQGLVVLMRVADLQDRDLLQTLNHRLQDLLLAATENVPLYLMLIDLHQLPGFDAFSATLTAEEQQQLFGISLPVALGGNRSVHVAEALAQLQQRLQGMLTRALYQERQLDRRKQLMSFPNRFEQMCGHLSDALSYCLPASSRVLLRGIHFTGQRLSPSGQSSLVPALGPAQPRPGTQPAWVFTQRWWLDLVRGDQGLAGWSSVYRRSRWVAGTAVVLVATLVFGGISVWQVQSFRFGQQRLEQVKQVLSRQDVSLEQAEGRNLALPQVLSLVQLWSQADSGTAPGMLWPGLAVTDEVAKPIADYRTRLLREALLPLMSERAEAILTSSQEPEALLAALKVYLMLALPERRDNAMLAGWYAEDSADVLQGRGLTRQWLEARVLEALGAQPEALPVDQSLIQQARNQLNQIPREQQLYLRVKQAARYQGLSGFRYGANMGSEGATTFEGGTFEVPALFTLQGYSRVFVPELNRLLDEYEETRWILGAADAHPSGEDLERLRTSEQQTYADDYVRYWQTALNQLRLVRVHNLEHLLGLLNALTAPASPLRMALKATTDHTQYALSGATDAVSEQAQVLAAVDKRAARVAQKAARIGGALEQVGDQATPDYLLTIRERFQSIHRLVPGAGEPTTLAPLFARLGDLQHYVGGLTAGNSRETMFRAVAQRFQQGGTDPLSELQIVGRQMPEPVRSWVLDLADQAWAVMLQQTQEHIAVAYYDGVKAYYDRHLQGRYPLFSRAKTEASFEHFSEFFGRDGINQRFFDDYLSPFVETGRNRWAPRQISGRGLALSPELLQQFQRARRIRQALFAGEQGFKVKLALRPLFLDANVSRFELRLDDQRMSYRHGPQRPTSLEWPAARAMPGVGVMFEDYNGLMSKRSFDGNWSLLRLLEQFELESVQDGGPYQMAYELDGRRVVYSLQGGSDLQVLLHREVQQFRLPDLSGS